jgi:hypothetical protein
VERLRDQLFSGSALSEDQHGGVRVRDSAGQLQDTEQLGIASHEGAEVVARIELLASRGPRAARGRNVSETERGAHDL